MAPTTRMSNIIANVQDTYHAVSNNTFDADQITRYVNRGIETLARKKGYFLKETVIDLPAATELDLINGESAPIPDLIEVKALVSNLSSTSTVKVVQCNNYGQLLEYENQTGASVAQYGIMTLNHRLYVRPQPAVAIENAIIVFHSYTPADVSIGDTPTDPPTPPDFDEGLEFYVCLRQAMKDLNRTKADQRVLLFQGLWDQAVTCLISAGTGTDLAYEPARRGR